MDANAMDPPGPPVPTTLLPIAMYRTPGKAFMADAVVELCTTIGDTGTPEKSISR